MTYSIVLYGEPVLEKQAAAVTEFDTPELHQLIEDMFESMYAAKGVGLAAPQIGIAKRIAVIDLSVAEDPAAEDRADQSGDHSQGRISDRRRGLPEPARISRAGDAAQERDGARPERQGRIVRDDRRGSAGARLLP